MYIEEIGDSRLKKMLKLDNNAQFSCHSESSSSGAVFYAVFLPEAKSVWKSPDEKSVRLMCSKLNPLTDVSLDKTQMAQRLAALMEIHWKEPDWAAIHYAVACGFTSYLATMIMKDPEIVLNYATADGRFPLNIAAQTEQLDSLRLLLIAGAPLNQSDASGRTVVHWAAASSATILKELSSSSSFQPCLLMLDGDGMSPLAVAIRAGNLESVKLIMGVSAPLGALSSWSLLNAVVGLKYSENLDKILELIISTSPAVANHTDGGSQKVLDHKVLDCILRYLHVDMTSDKDTNNECHLAAKSSRDQGPDTMCAVGHNFTMSASTEHDIDEPTPAAPLCVDTPAIMPLKPAVYDYQPPEKKGRNDHPACCRLPSGPPNGCITFKDAGRTGTRKGEMLYIFTNLPGGGDYWAWTKCRVNFVYACKDFIRFRPGFYVGNRKRYFPVYKGSESFGCIHSQSLICAFPDK